MTSSHLKFLKFAHWLRCLLDTLALQVLNSDYNSVTLNWLLRNLVYVQWNGIWRLAVSYWHPDLCFWETHWLVRSARQFGTLVPTVWSFLQMAGHSHASVPSHSHDSHFCSSTSTQHVPFPLPFLPRWQSAARGLFTPASAFQDKYSM
jgi:hypothetical protein